MLKKCFLLLVTIALMATPLTCLAQDYQGQQVDCVFAEVATGDFIASGYTEDGIYYEVYGESISTYFTGYITVSRTVVYDGVVRPSSTMEWEELIGNAMYSGTLSLSSFSVKDGKTVAVYTGKLYRE